MKPLHIFLTLTLLSFVSHLPAQTATDFNSGQRLKLDTETGYFTYSWWGQSGKTYFMQQSLNLTDWTYTPALEDGANAPLEWSFGSSASRGFLRLRITNQGFMPDDWLSQYNLSANTRPFEDTDGDGISNSEEFQNGTDPTDYYNGVLPTLAILRGSNQWGTPNAVLAVPFTVGVNGAAYHAPVTFTVTQGGALLSADGMSGWSTSVSVRSTSSFVPTAGSLTYGAQVYIKLPAAIGNVSTITASATSGGQMRSISTLATVSETGTAPAGDAPPPGVVAGFGSNHGNFPVQVGLAWQQIYLDNGWHKVIDIFYPAPFEFGSLSYVTASGVQAGAAYESEGYEAYEPRYSQWLQAHDFDLSASASAWSFANVASINFASASAQRISYEASDPGLYVSDNAVFLSYAAVALHADHAVPGPVTHSYLHVNRKYTYGHPWDETPVTTYGLETLTIPMGQTFSNVVLLKPEGEEGFEKLENLEDIDFSVHTDQGSLATSKESPFRFWINNDFDSGENNAEIESFAQDSQDGYISNKRDLEDFAMLEVKIPDVLYDKVSQGQAQLGLKWKNTEDTTPGVKLYSVAEVIHKPQDYLWNESKADSQLNTTYGRSMLGYVKDASTVWLPANAIRKDSGGYQHPYLLFEGVAKGKGELCLVVKLNDHEADGASVWLNLVDVQEMYEKAEGTPNKNYPNPPTYATAQPPQPTIGQHTFTWPGKDPFIADPAETDEAIVFVHGWNMENKDRRTYANSFFKRLWWKGFRGRFCAFSWPTYNADNNTLFGLVPAHYNQSEYVAWKYGPALKQYVDSLNKTSKNVAAHSMGNVVMASALKAGLTVNSYVAMEAAIPAGCYDASDEANNFIKFADAESTNPTTGPGNPAPVYRGFMAGVNIPQESFHNFYNSKDFALKTGKKTIEGRKILDTNWEANEVEHKPNWRLHYRYEPTAVGEAKNQLTNVVYSNPPVVNTRNVTDPHEVLSFIARPRSEALGATVKVTQDFSGFDLGAPARSYPFTGLQTEHSGQFERPIQRTHFFYNEMLDRMGVQFNNLGEGNL